jgi:hypothetical protein
LCSEWEENRESIISFFKPKSPTIARWLKPVGREVEHFLGWEDHVLDGTHVAFPRLIMSFKQVNSGKVTKQRLDRLRLKFSSGSKASHSLVHKGQIEFIRRLYAEQYQDTEEAASALAHAVIDSCGGIWTNSAVRRRARLTINQNNETNTSISNSWYCSTYSKPSISNSQHRSTKMIKKINCLSRE